MPITPIFTAHDRIVKGLINLQINAPFFSYILMHFKITATSDENIPTAGVDKEGNLYYADDFINSLNLSEIIGVLVHEVLHISKGDFLRRGHWEENIWNIASDAIINYILNQEGYDIPKCGINPDKSGQVMIGSKTYQVANKITEELYEELIKNADKIKIPTIGHGGFDIHLPSSNKSTSESSTEAKWKKIIIEAAVNARARGKLPGFMEATIDKLMNPVIDWRSRIQKFITSEIPIDYSNRMPSRKFYGTGIWSPSIIRENLEISIGVDVSGSTIEDRKYFISEVAGILCSYEQVKARLIFWDAFVNSKNDYILTKNNKDLLTNIKIEDCNGGTMFSSYSEYLDKMGYKSHLHIVFTDGKIEKNPKVPNGSIIFVIPSLGSIDIIKNYGSVCRLTDLE